MDKILVQDTDQDILELLAIILQEGGYTVMTTRGCEEILKQIDEFGPHVVMLDFKLSGQECIKAYHKIRSKYPHLPVIALSCNSNIHSEYSKIGFDGYIKKPFDIDEMYVLLRKYMPHSQPNPIAD